MFFLAVCYIFYDVCIIGLRIICEGFVRVSDTKKLVLTSNQILFGQGLYVCHHSSVIISHHQYTRTIAAVHNNLPNFVTFRSERLSDDSGVLIEEYNPGPWVQKQLTTDVTS